MARREQDHLRREERLLVLPKGIWAQFFNYFCSGGCQKIQERYGQGVLNLTQAFPSIPHDAIHRSLESCGAPANFRKVTGDIYRDGTTRFEITDGRTEKIDFGRGIRQGDGCLPCCSILLFYNFISQESQLMYERLETREKKYYLSLKRLFLMKIALYNV